VSANNVSELKASQDQLENRKTELLDSLIPFRNEFIETIEQFARDAIAVGLKGVGLATRRQDNRVIVELAVRLNEADLVIVANDGVYYSDTRVTDLAAKLFVFYDGSDDNTPLFDIIVEEGPEGFRYTVRRFTSNGAERIAQRSVAVGAGRDAAERVLSECYKLRHFWHDKPSLGAVRKGRGVARPIGFQKG
jgi:hypothetical protein